jgi:hypothetical protein
MKSALNNNSTFRTLNVRPPLNDDPPTGCEIGGQKDDRPPTVGRGQDENTPVLTLPDFELHGAGIDKLNTVVRSFTVPDAKRLNVDVYGRRAGQDEAEQRPLLNDELTGEIVQGRRAYYNGQDYSLNIDGRGMQVVCSPSKVLHPNRPYLLTNDPDEIHSAYDVVRKRIQTDTGILLDYSDANVCRLDIARQHEMPRSIRNYAPAFQLLKLKGTREQRRNYGDQTWNFNSSKSAHQFSFYDKLTEYLSSSSSATTHNVPDSNYLRAELRLLKTDYIRKTTKTNGTFQELLNGGTEMYSATYDTYLRGKLFHGNYQTELAFDVDRLEHLFYSLNERRQRDTGGTGTYNRIVQQVAVVVGVRDIVDRIGLDVFLSVASKYVTDRHVRRTRAYILEQSKLSNELFQPVDTVILLNELRTAFLKAA